MLVNIRTTECAVSYGSIRSTNSQVLVRPFFLFGNAEYTSYKKRSSMEGSPKVFGGSTQFQSASMGSGGLSQRLPGVVRS
mmetsp:Transcript_8089/g.50015  ORF Transcript_8089/g.50015 Transcript_8089/m.50015 type:complete len:80 (+) Transcript_8089:400-639(+)